jgi:hypothetical protein
VEGAEPYVLEGAKHLIEQRKPVLLIALHGAQQRERCLGILKARGTAYSIWTGPSSTVLPQKPTRSTRYTLHRTRQADGRASGDGATHTKKGGSLSICAPKVAAMR